MLYAAVQPGRPVPSRCLLHVSPDAAAVVVKSVFAAVAAGGCMDVGFVVQRLVVSAAVH